MFEEFPSWSDLSLFAKSFASLRMTIDFMRTLISHSPASPVAALDLSR